MPTITAAITTAITDALTGVITMLGDIAPVVIAVLIGIKLFQYGKRVLSAG